MSQLPLIILGLSFVLGGVFKSFRMNNFEDTIHILLMCGIGILLIAISGVIENLVEEDLK